MKLKTIAALAAAALLGVAASTAQTPKTEFRGAWLHTIFQGQYKSQTTDQNKAYLISQLDSLKDAGVNAVLFQVRPQSDALYADALEPWSRFLTDGGKAPEPFWDPLQFMIDQCHLRGMELHAWLNPYRVTSNKRQTLPQSHIYHSHPERFIRYDGKLYFDPGQPENREFIGRVVDDIVARYDVDGIHFDDYFYPYPVKGMEFAEDYSYRLYGNGMSRD
ncbi:MAG: family 10 glycosylhydrolase, partial [Muribaculaceae bacterium]|nr:family 10 glycosylhydrolase [Muribaculaceae bacterium]